MYKLVKWYIKHTVNQIQQTWEEYRRIHQTTTSRTRRGVIFATRNARHCDCVSWMFIYQVWLLDPEYSILNEWETLGTPGQAMRSSLLRSPTQTESSDHQQEQSGEVSQNCYCGELCHPVYVKTRIYSNNGMPGAPPRIRRYHLSSALWVRKNLHRHSSSWTRRKAGLTCDGGGGECGSRGCMNVKMAMTMTMPRAERATAGSLSQNEVAPFQHTALIGWMMQVLTW